MYKKYYYLLAVLVVVSTLLAAILVYRANQTDKYFEFKRNQEEQSFKTG